MRRLMRSAMALVLMVALAVPANAGRTLDQIKARGTLRCGVGDGLPGLAALDGAGRWAGLDADFCRALAAAVLNDADKVMFVPLRSAERFPALRLDRIDVLVRNTTWTLAREAGLNILFAGIIRYDGQGFIVPETSPARTPLDLGGRTVCMEKATTYVERLADYAETNALHIEPLILDSSSAALDAFFAGRCDALSADRAALAAARLRAPEGRSFVVLSDVISREPIGPVVRSDDTDWFTVVRWVLFTLIRAEENGVTRANVRTVMSDTTSPQNRRTIAADAELGRMLAIAPGWSVRAVESVGNYGEIFERNLGAGSPLKMERGLNRLWTQGGLMFAPPLR